MTKTRKPLRDDPARRAAMLAHGRSLLVEAGAGSGKTALLAGRITMMLAGGVAPKAIAAVTFTELAASELLLRVRDFVGELLSGKVPAELGIALPDGLSPAQRKNLETASATLDEIVCSTIHGFCQRLITPYPVEANIDPGATVMDPDEADLVFEEILEGWLRESLSTPDGGILAQMVLHDPDETVALVRRIVKALRRQRTAVAPAAPPLMPAIANFRDGAKALAAFLRQSKVDEPDVASYVDGFGSMAADVSSVKSDADAAGLVTLVTREAHASIRNGNGSIRKIQRKGKWTAAAKRAGCTNDRAAQSYADLEVRYEACRAAWDKMRACAASRVVARLVGELQPVLRRFREHKRSAARLDFEDLIHAARDLVRDHDEVRRALAARHAHILVDEFQDTDPLQTEIFWRLCGEPPKANARWQDFRIRPGALFLVGDPKQAIYRFRGADVNAYVLAREAFRRQDPRSVVEITTNFRSQAPILAYVNATFEALLSAGGQPGFARLDPFRNDGGDGPFVAALDVALATGDEEPSIDAQRDAEAAAVAELCARLIGNEPIADVKTGQSRPCRPGDIALLAPTGTALWRYEAALERYGIPVATQAGKGLYRRQEIQDLIAITRVLADSRDTLALGALLRGPLVGMTEEELLDIVWGLRNPGDDPAALPKLRLYVDVERIAHPLARDVLHTLQQLRLRANSTTPHDLLSQAVDALRVRPILLQRHRGHSERALANVDLYLRMSRAYAVRGLRAFADAMTAAWTDETRAVEGRPDAQEDAVALYTMHAAKGLEWPIVVPVNTMTRVMAADALVTDRENDHLYCPVFGVAPVGHETAFSNETDELDRERVRLWYVAATRARELLVIPKPGVPSKGKSWSSLVDLAVDALPVLDRSQFPTTLGLAAKADANAQTREVFVEEASAIEAARRRLKWVAPSRDEGASQPLVRPAEPDLLPVGSDGEPRDAAEAVVVQGGRERGLVIHKLFEEVLTGETAEDPASLAERAGVLALELGQAIADDPAKGLSPKEIAGCVARTLALPEIAALRPTLVPEFSVYASANDGKVEEVTAGVADAISVSADGALDVVIDWKSDVKPSDEAVAHYRAQVRNYLAATGAGRGMVVFVTSGRVVTIERQQRPLAADGSGGAPVVESMSRPTLPDEDAVPA